MRKLLIATRNQGKIKEILADLVGLDLEVIGLDEAGVPKEFAAEESAMTMEGNAILKAITYGMRTGLLTLADDAGLEVDALDGQPGIFSARYVPGTDEDRYRKVLEELKDVPDGKRTARLRTVVAIFDPMTTKVRTCEGVYHGIITREPQGAQGFGYDPIFWNGQKQKTNAQMTPEEKNAVSHRGQALAKAKKILAEEFPN
jgi:XTP/dITP diphosphohydrolase